MSSSPSPPPEFCLAFVDTWATCMTKSEWSGWAQAVFSVLAILAAVTIAEVQHWRQRKADSKRHWEERLVIGRACFLAAEEAGSTIDYIARQLRAHKGQRYRLRMERVSDLLATFQTLLSKNVPPELLRDLMTVQRELSYTLMALQQLWYAHEVSMRRIENAEARAARVGAAVKALELRHSLYGFLNNFNHRPGEGTRFDFSEMHE